MATVDEREGKPSASYMERLYRCPGSWAFSKRVPAIPPGPEADSGSRIHAYLSGDPIPLDEGETHIAEECLAVEEQVLERVGMTVCGQVVREMRLWDLNRSVSGKADAIYLSDQTALVIDYKTGRGEVPAAKENLQLATLAVLTCTNFIEVNKVYVAIIQPLAEPRYTIAEYDEEDFIRYSDMIDNAVKALLNPTVGLTAGDWCRYCPCKPHCPEFSRHCVPAVIPDKPDELVKSLTVEQCKELWEKRGLVDALMDSVEDRLKALPEPELTALGLRMKPGAVKEKITDPDIVYERAVGTHGLSKFAFLDCVEVKKGKLQSSIKSKTGKNGKELDAIMDSILDGCVEEKQNKPSLAKL